MTLWSARATTRLRAYLRTRLAWDTFSRGEADSWGNTETTSSTLAWTTAGGAAANFDVAGGAGTVTLTSVDAARYASAGSGFGDVEITGSVSPSAVATGDSMHAGPLARFVDTSNHYGLLIVFDTGGTVDAQLFKFVAGSFTSLQTANDELAYSAGTTVKYRFQCYDTSLGAGLKGRIWLSTEDEPEEWTVEHAADNTPALLLGGVGVRAYLAAANTNTNPVMSFDDFIAFSSPQWTDITDSILQGSRGQPIEGFTGRSTELATIDPSTMGFTLKNATGWFTANNTASPYWPDWKAGCPLRWSETIGPKTFTFPDMWLEVPETALSFEAQGDPELSDRVLRASCVDLLTRLNRAPAFVSSLSAYIIGEATEGALRAYWPLADGSGSTYAAATGPITQEPLRFQEVSSYNPVRFVDDLIEFGADGPPGDDGTSVEFAPINNNQRGRLGNNAVNNTTLTDASVATVCVWVYVPAGMLTLDQLLITRDFVTSDVYLLIDSFGGANWRADANTTGGIDDAAVSGEIVSDSWHFVSAQMDFSTGDFELWVDDMGAAAGACGAGGATGMFLDRMVIDGGEGTGTGVRMCHIQLYIGDSDSFTHSDHLAQYDVGMTGYGQQTVDRRIRTIANYAGIGDGQLDLDESDSLIQEPAFVGQRPGELASAAALTGGGYLFTQGDRLVYHDRKRRFGL